jgi:hypothetical protein
MVTLADRILSLVTSTQGLSDREIADRLYFPAAPQQPVNIACRSLAAKGLILRTPRPDGRIGNYPAATTMTPVVRVPADNQPPGELLGEDQLKRHLEAYLAKNGWKTDIKWGKAQGVDIEALRGTNRWIIEAKGEGSRDPMRVNYFLCVLGELLQRMTDENAKYSIALPDHKQFRGLWTRLPSLAKDRTRITALFVDRTGGVQEL